MNIAVLGLGAMGGRIAGRLLSQGQRVTVYNRTPTRAAPLAALGAEVAASAAAAVADADIVITSLRGEDAIAAVAGEIVGAMRPGAVHVSTSTLSPALAAELAARHRDAGVGYLSAPVQGRPEAAESGQLLVWASGPRETFDQAEPVLRQIATAAPWIGDSVEQGPATKLVVNMLMFANVELFAETFDYLRRCGVDPALIGSLLTESSFAAPLFKGIVAGLGGHHASSGTTLDGSLKDLQMLVTQGDHVQAPLPAARVVSAQYARAAAQGHGGLAQTAVLLALK